MTFKPMLAATLKSLDDIKSYPVYVSAKLDGIRATIIEGKLVSRTLKPIPNKYVRECLEHADLEGIDGELIVGNPIDPQCFRNTTSAIMAHEGKPDFKFYIHDRYHPYLNTAARYTTIDDLMKKDMSKYPIEPVIQHMCWNKEDIQKLYDEYVKCGYEGIIVKAGFGVKYKHGRSTLKEELMMKYKPIEDKEAKLLEIIPHSKHPNEIGAFKCLDIETGVIFKIGTGFTAEDRYKFSYITENIGKIVKYTHQGLGSNGAPRFPVFKGFRDKIDLDL